MRQNLKSPAALAAALLIAAGAAQALPVAPLDGGSSPALAPTQIRAGHGGGHGGGFHGGGHGGGFHGGHHGGGAYHGGYHGSVHHGGAYHGGVYRAGGAWVRPYRWAPGGAIAAGAAIGFVSAAAAAAWASASPQPGLCWYYTDPSRRSGFWDTCP